MSNTEAKQNNNISTARLTVPNPSLTSVPSLGSFNELVTDSITQQQIVKKPEDFKFLKQIGEGSFSTVYYAREVGTDKDFAVKVCMKQHIKKEKKVEYVKRERLIMAKISAQNHPFFVQLYCSFQNTDKLFFVMTLAKNGELLDFMRKLGSFDDEVTRFYSAEIVAALHHLHSVVGVVHRDLKPENILLSERMHILISDFGSAKIQGTDDEINLARPTPMLPAAPVKKRSSFVGTAQYLSPEVLSGELAGPSCDLWALGCIIYQMLSGLPPFRAANEYLVFQKIIKLDYGFPSGFPDTPKSLVEGLLKRNPSERIGAEERGGIAELKSHPFFVGVEWNRLPELEPPDLMPYLPASGDQPAFHSTYKVPENYDNVQPGLDDRQLTRLLGLELNDIRPEESLESKHILNISSEERERRLKEQRKTHPYRGFVEGNLIIKSGLIDKRKGLFARRRMFLLTEGPRLYYVDPSAMVLKGQVPWSDKMRPEAKNFKTFFVHTPNRTYYLEDPSGHAPDWCDAIEQVREFYFCNKSTSA